MGVGTKVECSTAPCGHEQCVGENPRETEGQHMNPLMVARLMMRIGQS